MRVIGAPLHEDDDMRHADDVGVCERCRRWQRRKHAFVQPSDHRIRELCATHGCDATWDDDVVVVMSAVHDADDAACRCGRCAHRSDSSIAMFERAADRGHVGPVVASPHAHREPHWS